MTTVADAIIRVRNDYLNPSEPDLRNKLASAVDASAETLTFSRPLGHIQAGSKLSLGLESVHVWSVDESAKTADVDRGEYGTTAVAHSSSDVVLVKPRYDDSQILRALNAGVSMLVSEGLFSVSSVDLTHLSAVNGYDLTSSSNVLGLLSAYWESTNASAKQWHQIRQIRLQQNVAESSDFASGTAVYLDEYLPHGCNVRVTYKHELSASLAALTDVVETVTGLESDAVDLLCLAAALHLTAGKEIGLNEPDAARSRRSRDVPPGSYSQADSNLINLYNRRVRAERRRLRDKYQTLRVR